MSAPASSGRLLGVVRSVFDQSTPANRLLTRGLAGLLLFVFVISIPSYFAMFPGVDLEIPLRAAGRWADGGLPYLPSSFAYTAGPNLPYLYPPWLLPFLVPIVTLPRTPVTVVWLALGVAACIWTCRRLSIPWRAVPFMLFWPPFTEGMVLGNVQVFQFAAFVTLFYLPGSSWRLRPRIFGEGRATHSDTRAVAARRRLRDDICDGLLAAGVGAAKWTQLLPVAALLRPRPRAAILGGAALVAVAAAMLPLTGVEIYRDWLNQLWQAADPSWPPSGVGLASLIGRPLASVVAVVTVLAMFFVRGRDAGAWVGIALLVAAPTIHGYGMLFLLPALFVLRRDLAIFLATIVARYNPYGWWISIAVAAIALAASGRFPALRAQGPSPAPGPSSAIAPEGQSG